MKPLDQNKDSQTVIDFAAACIFCTIYYWNRLETTSFIGPGDEGNNEGCAKKCKLFQPTGRAIEFDNIIYAVDSQSFCVKIFTTLGKTAKFLETIGNLYKGFSVQEKKGDYNYSR